jgi:hypothetical protein
MARHATRFLVRIAAHVFAEKLWVIRKTDFARFSHITVGMKDVLYSEWVPVGEFVKTVFAAVSLIVLFVLVITIWVSISIQNPFLTVIIAIPLTFLLIMYGNYRGLRIRITARELVIHYGLLNRKRIHMSDIVSCEPTKSSFGKYWGVGIRYGTDRSLAYTTSFGDAVKIMLKEGRPFVFSSHNPQEICNIINQAKTNLSPGDNP